MTFQKSKKINTQIKEIKGWDRTKTATVEILEPKTIAELKKMILKAPPKSLIARGLGRSYGDAAQLNKFSVIELSQFNQVHLNPVTQEVTTGAGVNLKQLLTEIIPKGFFLPVTPGTKNITVGGAIAADVHGKNHHINGSFGNHVKRIVILNGKGEEKELRPRKINSKEPCEQFWATIGGMGLTGIIIESTFSVIPIETSFINVNTRRFDSIEELMKAMIKADQEYKYSVGWIDILNPEYRGVLTCGNHAEINQLTKLESKDPLKFDPRYLTKAPDFLPNGLMNKLTIKLFNETWFRKSSKNKTAIQSISNFFYPLDGVENWNNIYGDEGFIQYQFVVPEYSSGIIRNALDILKNVGVSSFLTVLKRFGKENNGYLSFPMSGWTLAIDIPASTKNLNKTLSELDNEVSKASGRLYLAKDSRQSKEMFKETYKKYPKWKSQKYILDPKKIFWSDIASRLDFY